MKWLSLFLLCSFILSGCITMNAGATCDARYQIHNPETNACELQEGMIVLDGQQGKVIAKNQNRRAIAKNTKVQSNNKVLEARSKLRSINLAIRRYRMKRGRFPGSLDDLTPKYIDNRSELIDPWKSEYVLSVPGRKRKPFEVFSRGADGIEGTGDDVFL